MMFSVEGELGPYLTAPNSCGVPHPKKVKEMIPQHTQLLSEIFPQLPSSVSKYDYVVVNGVHYAEKDAFVLSFVSGVPILGEIIGIYGLEDSTVFIYTKLQTEKYESSLNAFKVKHREELGIVSTSQIMHHERVPYIRSVSAHYVLITCQSFVATLM